MRSGTLLFLILPLALMCQIKYGLPDSLLLKLKEDSAHIYRTTLAKPYLKIENRNSFIINKPVDFYGGLIGATFWDKHVLAAGFYFLDKKSRIPVNIQGEDRSQQFLRFQYFNFAYQLVLVNRRFLQLNVPLEIGIGSYYARSTDSAGVIPVTQHHGGRFIPYSGGAQLIIKIAKWLGVSGTGGYRYVYNNENLLRFNGPFFSFGVWVDARTLLRNYKYIQARKKYFDIHQKATAK